jgi:hypothetical protein
MFHDHLHGNLLSYCRECAGFSWRTKGIKYLFNEWGFPLEGILRVTEIFDKMAKNYPEIFENHISQIVKDIELTVNLDEPEEMAEAA